MFYELIQVALGQREKLGRSPSDEEWAELFALSQKQGVVGVVLPALEKLSAMGQKPPALLLLEWIGLGEQIKERNRLVNQRCTEVTELFGEAGFRSCILKGQGNALMYPDPLLRSPGDIDIWVDGTRRDIRDFVVSRCAGAQDGELHIQFPIFGDVPVEVHYKPRYSSVPGYDKRLQAWFREKAEEQFLHRVRLGDSEICVPTTAFNAVHQMSHIMGHFFVEGIGLRQFVDYYYVLGRLHEERGAVDYERLFGYLGMLRFARGVMWVEREVLGLCEKHLICEPDERIGSIILREIEEGGNFGRYDQRYAFRKKGLLARGITDCYRLVKLACYFPEDALWKIVRKVENQKWKIA